MFVVTFYSYKGGVGRTSALANVAYRLANRGKRVFVLDFDLEAPGIDAYGLSSIEEPHQGLVEYVGHFTSTGTVPPINEYVLESDYPGTMNRLFYMPAGKKDESYQSELSQLDWKVFYKQKRGYLFVENLKAAIKDVYKPDYVLVDSRTGLTDISGICTLQLPSLVVLLFSLNEQNVNGIAHIYRSIKHNRLNRNISTSLVASPIPDLPEWVAVRSERFEYARKTIGAAVDLIIPYDPFLAFQESIIRIQEDEEEQSYLGRAYDQLAEKIILQNTGDVLTLLKTARELRDEGSFELAELHYREVIEGRPDSAEAWLEFGKFLKLRDKAEEACEYFEKALKLRPDDTEILAQLTTTYAKVDKQKAIGYHKSLLRLDRDIDRIARVSIVLSDAGLLEQAAEGFEKVIDLDEGGEVGVYVDLAETRMRLKQYREAANTYLEGLKVEPMNLVCTYNAAYALSRLGDPAAIDYFKRAVDLWEQLDKSDLSNAALANSHVAISHAYIAITQPNKAVAALERALSLASSLDRKTRIFSSLRYMNVPRTEFVSETRKLLSVARQRLSEKENKGKRTMANVYVEARPKGRPEGSAIDDYVVEDHADHVLGTFKTQKEAVDWAKANGHHPLVARVRHLNDKKTPDCWRSA